MNLRDKVRADDTLASGTDAQLDEWSTQCIFLFVVVVEEARMNEPRQSAYARKRALSRADPIVEKC